MENKLFATPHLAAVRELQGLTQAGMAELLTLLVGKKISASLYQKWEQGTLGVTPDVAVKICKATKEPISELWETRAAV